MKRVIPGGNSCRGASAPFVAVRDFCRVRSAYASPSTHKVCTSPGTNAEEAGFVVRMRENEILHLADFCRLPALALPMKGVSRGSEGTDSTPTKEAM